MAKYRTMSIYAILLMLLYLLNTITIESICDIMKNNLVRSTLILSIATLMSKVLGSIFRIPLQNIAGDEVLGIFSLVYPVYMVALNLSVAGIPVAISKLISEAAVSDNKREIRKIYTTAIILALLFGIISFLFILGFSTPISGLLGGESTRLSLIIVSTTLLIAPYMAVYRGYFQGFENMNPTAISQVLEQFIRVALILTIAFFLVKQNYSNSIIAGGIMASSVLGALVSLIYLRRLFIRSNIRIKKEPSYLLKDFWPTSKKILRLSLPICVGAIAASLINFVDSLTIPISLIRLGTSEESIHYQYGIYSRGLSLVQIATVFSSSIVLPLIPTISKAIADQDFLRVKKLTQSAHYYTYLISWPAGIGMFALTLPINLALFKDLEGSLVLSFISVSAVFMSISILGTGILQGINRAGQAARIILFSVLLKVIFNYLFIDWLGLLGAAFSTVAVYMVVFMINTYFIWRITHFTFWDKKMVSIIFSSIIMGVVVGLPTLFIDFSEWNRLKVFFLLIFLIFIGTLVYIILLLITKGLKKEDLSILPFMNKINRK
jgi:O-antigen/teichoic acid export membrane protein